jgi:hypothetical protein
MINVPFIFDDDIERRNGDLCVTVAAHFERGSTICHAG